MKLNICRLSGILECSFWGYKMREMLLDFVYSVCFPLASSILLKCSKLYSSTRVLGKYSNSWVPRKENITENYFFRVHFIMQKLLIIIFNDSVFNYNNIRDVLNVFLLFIWHTIHDMNKYWIFWKIFFKIYRKNSSYSKNKRNNSFYEKFVQIFLKMKLNSSLLNVILKYTPLEKLCKMLTHSSK